jgi:protein-S-isoprenylcysteine O-methyltransferase Ste14
MKRISLDTAGMAVNGLSIALFFYLASTLDVPNVPIIFKCFAWLLFTAGLILIILSAGTLMANREADLMDRGVYGVIRHPMYLGAMLLFLAWIFFLPHWIVLIVSFTNIVIVYWFTLQGERNNISKFGDTYKQYMERVPRINLIVGLFRILRIK